MENENKGNYEIEYEEPMWKKCANFIALFALWMLFFAYKSDLGSGTSKSATIIAISLVMYLWLIFSALHHRKQLTTRKEKWSSISNLILPNIILLGYLYVIFLK